MEHQLKKAIEDALERCSLQGTSFEIEHPAEPDHGDYSTNIAFIAMRQAANALESHVGDFTWTRSTLGSPKTPRDLAVKIVEELEKNKPAEVEKIEIAGPGFINFYLSREFFAAQVKEILQQGDAWGRNETLAGKKVMVEYTDANPFKVFHIGHLMSNTIGEAISRVVEFSGAEVKRATYFGDVGVHIAKAIWGMQKMRDTMPADEAPLETKTAYLGEAYARGAKAYEEDAQAAEAIKEINKKLYERSDETINTLYDTGRQWSLSHFETIYRVLGTHFDYYFPESEVGDLARTVVRENMGKVFEESDGAVVFHAEKYDPKLHTRVFLSSQGLPVYEAKELALAKTKYDRYPYDISVVVTGNEIEAYFQVLLTAMRLIFPELAEKTVHKPHGMLRLTSGKMSSRTGNVITGESLLQDSIAIVEGKMKEDEDAHTEEKTKRAQHIGVGALKYSILKQGIGKNITYDPEKSFSLEGDSGPYLQYACVRANSVLEKGKEEGVEPSAATTTDPVAPVERLLYQFPEVTVRALKEYEPHHIVTYLTALAGAFNSYYAANKILGEGEKTPYRLALTQAVAATLKNGLYLLGISVPERM